MNAIITLTVIALMAINIVANDEIKADSAKIRKKICDPNSRPSTDQWKAAMECIKETEHERRIKEELKECLDKATDVNNLKSGNERGDYFVVMYCSKSFNDCYRKKLDERKSDNNNQPKQEISDEQKKKMMDQRKQIIDCTKKAYGIN